MKLCRTLQADNVSKTSKFFSPTVTADPSSQTMDGSDDGRSNPTTQFDAYMALPALIVVAAFFCIGFLSICIRRYVHGPEHTSAPYHATPNRKGGLDPSAVRSLPLVAYGEATERQVVDECPICLGEFEDRETVKLIPNCGHVFHAACVDTWLSEHVTCPLCRSDQLFSSGDEEEGGVARCDAATQV